VKEAAVSMFCKRGKKRSWKCGCFYFKFSSTLL